jgi:hypothetical protein
MPSEQERFAYGSILEALSKGLYPDKRHIIREFVQNSFDSIYELRRTHPKAPSGNIAIKIHAPSIFIADRGVGMTEAQVRQYRYLGFSQKDRTRTAGFRGIGKYSSSAVAKKLIVDTSPIDVPKRYRVTIHADGMMTEIQKGKNPPLEELLMTHSEVHECSAPAGDHYTFVELHGISEDSQTLMEEKNIRDYLARTAPVPFDPKFQFGAGVNKKLVENVPEFMSPPLLVNGASVYKVFFPNCYEPGYETILFDERRPEVLAFGWYCQNREKGQLEPKDDAGLVFRVKNIAVGDGHLARRMLWRTTPERAAYFFGEIHVLDPEVVPSSDRVDFEDNAARRSLADKCQRISSILRTKAGKESAIRRFDEAVEDASDVITKRADEIKSGKVPLELKDEVAFEIKKIQEDLQKRLKGPKKPSVVRGAQRVMRKSREVLSSLQTRNTGFVDLQRDLKFDQKLRALYETILEVLKEEFRHQPERLERVIQRIHEAIRARLAA